MLLPEGAVVVQEDESDDVGTAVPEVSEEVHIAEEASKLGCNDLGRNYR